MRNNFGPEFVINIDNYKIRIKWIIKINGKTIFTIPDFESIISKESNEEDFINSSEIQSPSISAIIGVK